METKAKRLPMTEVLQSLLVAWIEGASMGPWLRLRP